MFAEFVLGKQHRPLRAVAVDEQAGAADRQATADLIAWAFYSVVLGKALRKSSPWGRFRDGARPRAAPGLPFWNQEVSDAVAARRAARRAGAGGEGAAKRAVRAAVARAKADLAAAVAGGSAERRVPRGAQLQHSGPVPRWVHAKLHRKAMRIRWMWRALRFLWPGSDLRQRHL